MKYEQVKHLSEGDFKRATGVERVTFDKMVEVAKANMRDFGRPPKLSREDQILLTLMYLREYRTEYHIGLTYGVSEATVCRTIRKVETVLMKSREFSLPGRKSLREGGTELEVVIVDATEQPIQRPKKNSADITVVRRKLTPRKRNS